MNRHCVIKYYLSIKYGLISKPLTHIYTLGHSWKEQHKARLSYRPEESFECDFRNPDRQISIVYTPQLPKSLKMRGSSSGPCQTRPFTITLKLFPSHGRCPASYSLRLTHLPVFIFRPEILLLDIILRYYTQVSINEFRRIFYDVIESMWSQVLSRSFPNWYCLENGMVW